MATSSLELIFLGTGTPGNLDRANPSLALCLPHDEVLLLDTAGGNELMRQLRAAGIDAARIHHIFLSHQHFDHAAGLPLLLLYLSSRGTAPVTVHCHPETAAAVRQVIEVECPGVLGARMGDRLRWNALEEGKEVALETAAGEPLAALTPFATQHPVTAMGCRVACDGAAFVYGGDTSPFPKLGEWVAGADLLVHEASGRDDAAERWHAIGHSTAGDAARLAASAGVRHLVLTHFLPMEAAQLEEVAAEARSHFSGALSLAEDLARYQWRDGVFQRVDGMEAAARR
jgi:ribonuclease Z